MKVLLIVPTFKYGQEYPAFLSASDFPSGFAYISAALRKAGHETVGLNLNNITGYPSERHMITDEIRKALRCNPDLIATGGLCIDYQFFKDCIKIVRMFNPTIPIVLGGGIVTHDAEFIFNLLKPDFCIIGEAEEAMVNLCNMIESGGSDYASIDNIGYWEDVC